MNGELPFGESSHPQTDRVLGTSPIPLTLAHGQENRDHRSVGLNHGGLVSITLVSFAPAVTGKIDDPSAVVKVSIEDKHRAYFDLYIDAPFYGDPKPLIGPGRVTDLWCHEAIEVALTGSDDRYLEIEFGPHGHWLMLTLDGGLALTDDEVGVRSYQSWIKEGRWRGRATVYRAHFPKGIVKLRCAALREQRGKSKKGHTPAIRLPRQQS